MKIPLSILCSLFLISCNRDYNIAVPEELPIGTNVFFVDGKSRTFSNNLRTQKLGTGELATNLLFEETFDNGVVNQLILFTTSPTEKITYTISGDEGTDPEKMYTYFEQGYEEDLFGYEYVYNCGKDDFVILDKYDTINQIVSGSGQLSFKRIRKNGAPSGSHLDKYVTIDFAFNDLYEK